MDEEGEIHFLSDRFWNWGYTFEDGKHLFSRLNQSVVFVAFDHTWLSFGWTMVVRRSMYFEVALTLNRPIRDLRVSSIYKNLPFIKQRQILEIFMSSALRLQGCCTCSARAAKILTKFGLIRPP